jgi:hypothetical protein
MRDCRDVIMLAKPGYIYGVTNGGKNGSGKKVAGRKRREDREEMAGRRGGKRGSAERGGKRGPTNF